MSGLRLLTCGKFRRRLNGFAKRGTSDLRTTRGHVEEIIESVIRRGDKALFEYTERFDRVRIDSRTIRVDKGMIREAYKRLASKQIRSMKLAARNIRRFHRAQIQKALKVETSRGVFAGQILKPISPVGIYAPGGRSPYPSSVLMCGIPAIVAGVSRVILCSPPQSDGMVSPAVLVAADIAGLSEIYKVGGAQAIAAMAYGTNSIPKVKKIVGPGNVYVTTAKQLVTSEVAIDCPAGPSEVAILSDSAGNAKLIAADLLAQAEHDPRALIVFVTTSRELCRKVSEEIETQIASLRRATIIRSSLSCNGVAVLVRSLGEAVELVNELAPEHVQIMTRRPRDILPKIENAGAIFVGEYSPVALGDYSAGINHVLPTGGFARAYSGLGTTDFLRRISYLECSKKGLRLLAEHTVTLALTEGLDGHAKSVAIRSA